MAARTATAGPSAEPPAGPTAEASAGGSKKSSAAASKRSGRVRRTGVSWPWRWFGRGNRRVRGSQKTVKEKRAKRGSLWAGALSLSLRLSGAIGLCVLLGAAIFFARHFVYSSPRFALRTVRVSGTSHLAAAAITKRAAVPLGTNLLGIDTHAIENRLLLEPWLKTATVRRELPATLAIEVTENQPVALVALESLYLCDEDGRVFKRATPAEYGELTVVTGVGRAAYVLEPTYARAQIRAALAALNHYRENPARPPIGEVRIDRFGAATLYTRQGTAIQLGRGEPAELLARLVRFDAVWRTIYPRKPSVPAWSQPVMVFLDNHAHPDHVTVRF